ncbi:LOW QUALITY PROTEIN: intermembrane lipid transfer protein VPS13C [Menidia menidia]
MVFEALVSDLLNRFIGDYVENLDKSQLKIGIWGGNVVLENLKVKENALSELDVPFKVKAGQIGRLTLKIPWKNLYNDAVVATLEGLYLLVVPGATGSALTTNPSNAIQYDAEKEERYQQEAKQKELQRIEEALQAAARRASLSGDLMFELQGVVYKEPPNATKGRKKHKKHKKALKKLKGTEGKGDGAPDEKKDSFMEKLATQVIKNLQVQLSSVHLRYEDDLSDPQRPLSVGVTLSHLSLQTTDQNWKACILNEAAKVIYKLGRLESLCVYWNVNRPLFHRGSQQEIMEQLKGGISRKEQELPQYQYIFRPVFASAQMIINPNAELELKAPKASLHLQVEAIGLEVTRAQYLSMVELLEALDRLAKNAPYRRFRPDVPVQGNARLWWSYALSSILEVHVRRLSHMWSWSSIRQHRQNLRAYRSLYQGRLLGTRGQGPEADSKVQELEKVLDVFNITLARQQAQMEVLRSGQKLSGGKKPGSQKQGGFFSGWFGRKPKKEEESENLEPQGSELDRIMTPEEKQKLYTAIGYSGSSQNLNLPQQYVAVVVTFQLLRTSLTVREQPDLPEILKVQMLNLSSKIHQRPGAQAIRVEMALEHWLVSGLQRGGMVPSLISSVGGSSSSLLSLVFEVNPEESAGDQLLRVQSQPVEIIYDAATINAVVDFFRTGKGVDLEVLTSATLSKLEEIKEKTATGLSHVIQTRKVLDLTVDLQPSYLLIPKSGSFSATSELLILDFGSFQLHTVEQTGLKASSSSFSSLEEIMDRAYERYTMKLSKVQLLYSKSGEAWKAARLQGSSVQHVLQPLDFTLNLAQCMVEDPRMPRFRVSGELPLIHVKISDQKIRSILELVDSVPLPEPGSTPSTPPGKQAFQFVDARRRAASLPPMLVDAMETDSEEDSSQKTPDEEQQLTRIHFRAEVKEVLLELQADQDRTLLLFSISRLGAEGTARPPHLEVTCYLQRLGLDYCPPTGGPALALISSSEQHGSNLLKVEFIKADPLGPSFHSLFGSTEQTLKVEFSSVDFRLHTTALLSTISYLSGALPDNTAATPAARPRAAGGGRPGRPRTGGSTGVLKDGVFSFKLLAVLGCVHVEVCDDQRSLADIRVQGLHGDVMLQGSQTHISARLLDVQVLDADPKSVHSQIVSIVGDEVFSLSVDLTPSATEGSGYADTSQSDGRLQLNVGCVRLVYLHKFVCSLLSFADNFQTAKAALSSATATAAEKAASGVRQLAQTASGERSFRLALEVRLKAPLVVVPQSSSSPTALLVDLGLITVGNRFCLLPVDGRPLPAVIDQMEVQLTDLKLSRTCSGRSSSELLETVNLHLNIQRNLSASWFQKMAQVEISGDLKPLKLQLGQEDLRVLFRIVTENLGEAGDPEPGPPRPQASLQVQEKPRPTTAGPEEPDQTGEVEEAPDTLKFTVNIESVSLVLYQDDPEQLADLQHQQGLRLGEFALQQLRFSGRLEAGGSQEVSLVLGACTLDDLRTGVDRLTARTGGGRGGGQELVAILQQLYLCASVEFLMAVAQFFLQSAPPPAASERLPLRQTAGPAAPPTSRGLRLRAVLLDPEVVFVGSLVGAGAPALVASFQCDFSLTAEEDGGQAVRANLRQLQLLACPFVRDQQDQAVTTVLRPCSVALEMQSHSQQPLGGTLMVEEVTVKISPVILNTVMSITNAMMLKSGGEPSEAPPPDTDDLWAVRDLSSCNFWFLGVDQATEMTESFREPDGQNQGQSFTVQVKVVQMTLESGLSHRTVPLLLAESSLNVVAKNWSSLLQLRADMTLEVNYFNETHAVWEPLIERVDGGRRRWNLELEVKTNPVMDRSPVHGDDFVQLPEPRTAVSICSKDPLNLTVSQSSLSVFQHLAQAFSQAASTLDPSLTEQAAFSIRNCLGIPLMLQHSASLRPLGAALQGRLHSLGPDQSLDLDYAGAQPASRGKLSALQRQESQLFSLAIVPSGYSEISNIVIDRPGRRLYTVRGPQLQESVSVLLQVDAAQGNKVITVRSPLQIRNHFSVPFTILRYCPKSRSLQSVGQADPEKEFQVDLDTYRCQLFVRPAGRLEGRYAASSSCVSWQEQVHCSTAVRSVLQCPASDGGLLPLVVSTLAVPDQLQHIASNEEDWDPAYVLHLNPTATLRSLLPYQLRYMMENSADCYEVQEGATSDLLNARLTGEVVSLVLVQYQGRDWHGHIQIKNDLPEFFALSLACDSDLSLSVDLMVHAVQSAGRLMLSLFSPYWIINKTSRVLQYRAEEVSVKHPADFRDVVLFSFRKKNLFSRSKIQLCISTSSWSDSFSLDTVGSYGCVRCPANNMDFLVGVCIQMSSFNLTRIVTLSPFYTLVNKSSFELEVGELVGQQVSRWHYVPSTECLPLWPESGSGKLCVRVVGSESVSRSFFFDRQDSGTLLSLDLCGGIMVDVNVSDHSTIIGFSDYYEGAAPALLLNHTAWTSISYRQSGSAEVYQLKPNQARRFAWDDPAGTRTLCWSYLNHTGELDLLKDDVGQFAYDNKSQVHWVSFLDGRQRVLLFTEDTGVVTKARQAEELEQFQQEVKVSLQNLGVSLVNNSSRQEIAYIGVTSSGVVWEMKPKNRWKPFSQKTINLLEKTYQSQLSGKTEGGWVKLEPNLEVNLSRAIMMMRQPYSCPVRRNFLSGIQVEFKQSAHQRCLRAQLHWLQVDNQLPGAIFPIVFHPVAPPKSIALDSEPKPFIDMSVITRFNQHTSIMQFKYFMALVQEMAVKIDQGFLGAICALFAPAAGPEADRQKSGLIQGDLQLLQAELMEASLSDTSGLSFFEHFHISPIKLHLSLSLGSSGEDSGQDAAAAMQAVNLLLKSLGATLTDVDDIIFKLAFFEVKYQFYRREKLMWAVVRHYSEQFLKQMYVLVLGLDVLGNPFGLIRGLSEGVEAFFYEPFQGAVQGPEEFAEGFVIGVRSLLGHTVGGAAGMVSKITGSVGKGLAAITMDKEYQQKRREEMNRPPRDFGDSLAKGGKGLLKGVLGGVTGIVTKPVEGAKKEGAAGFFKGIGKGLVGVVARPTGGIVDMASSTFQGIQRAAESTEEVTKLRPTRLIKEDGIIRPYDLTDAQGFQLFQRSEIRQLDGEVFRAHCQYPGHRKTTIIITNRRVFCVKEMDFVGHFNKEWECLLENFYRSPAVAGSELKIYCKEQQKLKIPKRDAQEPVRTVQLRDPDSAQKLQAAICEAQVAQQQHRMVRQKSQRFLKPSMK